MKKIILLINIFIFLTKVSFGQENKLPIYNSDDLINMVSGNSYILMNDLKLPTTWEAKALSNFEIDGNGHSVTFIDNTNTVASNYPSLFSSISDSKIHNLNLFYVQSVEKVINSGEILGSIAQRATNSNITKCIVGKNDIKLKFQANYYNFGGGIIGRSRNTTIEENIFIGKSIIIDGLGNEITFTFGGITGETNDKNLIKKNLSINTLLKKENIDEWSSINIGEIFASDKIDGNSAITGITENEINSYILSTKTKFTNITTIDNNRKNPFIVTLSPEFTTIIIDNNTINSKVIIEGAGAAFFTGNQIGQLELTKDTKQVGVVNSLNLILNDGCILGEHGINNANEILYLRTPCVWTGRQGNGGDGSGWETIYLPFDAELITVEKDEKKDITNSDDHDPAHVPFGNKGATYWLKQFDGTETNTNGEMRAIFTQATAITKNMPYIISIPGGGGWTGTKYDFTKKVIGFKGAGPVNNTKTQIQQGNFIFENHPLDSKTESTGRYFINSFGEYPLEGEGDQFIARENGTLMPFRASITENNSSARAPYLRIAFDYNNATSITPSFEEEVEDLKIYTTEGEIIIKSKETKRITVYHVSSGMTVRKIELNPGTNTISGLQKGIYIIEGKKIVL